MFFVFETQVLLKLSSRRINTSSSANGGNGASAATAARPATTSHLASRPLSPNAHPQRSNVSETRSNIHVYTVVVTVVHVYTVVVTVVLL